jgi:translation elongation factor EF-Tu-like GTPase
MPLKGKVKIIKKKTSSPSSVRLRIMHKPTMLEPGPPPRSVPSVEEPVPTMQAVGVVTHYYGHLNVAVVQLNTGTLKTGDTIKIVGHATNLSQTVESMEYERRRVARAEAGQSVGIETKDHVREHDIVYLVR